MTSYKKSIRPVKIWIDGKIFKINEYKSINNNWNETNGIIKPDINNYQEEQCQLLNITENNGKFLTSFKIPLLYYSKLPYMFIKKLSRETNTCILLKNSFENNIFFESTNLKDLINAVEHIHCKIGQIREQHKPLQFLCIPCFDKQVQAQFIRLKQDILSTFQNEIDGLDENIFISDKKLHITVDVYALLDDNEKIEAINALNDYKIYLEDILKKTGPLKINISGLSCMQNNFKKANVIYANVKFSNETANHNLQNVVNSLSKHFYDRGLAKNYQKHVKLHMTIMNTVYRNSKNGLDKRRQRRQCLDATKILEKYKDYDFGHCDFDKVHLSQMSLTGDDGFYKPLAVIDLEAKETSELQ